MLKNKIFNPTPTLKDNNYLFNNYFWWTWILKWNEPHGISHTNAQTENETNNEPYIEENILKTTYKRTYLQSHI